jgi:hypothetical protein
MLFMGCGIGPCRAYKFLPQALVLFVTEGSDILTSGVDAFNGAL